MSLKGNRSATLRALLYVVAAMLVLTIVSAAIVIRPTQAAPPPPHTTANGITIQAGQPLPIFKFTPSQVTISNTLVLARGFEGIFEGQPLQQDTYLGNLRFTLPHTGTNSLLERYGASGGFYAYNTPEAFSEDTRGKINETDAQRLACQFLLDNQLVPTNVELPPAHVYQCDYDFATLSPYKVSLAYATGESAQGVALETTAIAAVVQISMTLQTGRYSQIPTIPLDGPGGHISLLFRTTDQDDGFSLDDSVPGLAAVAMPFYSREFEHLRNVPTLDMAAIQEQVEQMVRDSYPDAENVTVPDPLLVYRVEDAAVPQTVLEPFYKFEGIEVTDDGETIFLKDIEVPATESGEGGLGPDVSITSPANESHFIPGSNVTLVGNISGGAPPYDYAWTLDDATVLHTGTAAGDGQISHTTNQLPVISHDGIPAFTVVHLNVIDDEGVAREATLALQPTVAPSLYLPSILRDSSQLAAGETDTTAASLSISVPLAPTSHYRFGVEAGSDYPPYGPGGSDLPGVVPDAGGFRTSMLGLGWTQVFYWANANAWERDWRDCGLGGSDCTYGVDRADFIYWAGHGSNGGISLPSNIDSTWFPGDKARFQQVRWAGFASCKTLRAQWPTTAAPIKKWFGAFQGAHMLLGYNSNMADVAFGPRLVDNMRIPTFFGIEMPWAQRTIREAWVLTAFQMNAGKPAYIYAKGTNGVNPVNNKLPKAHDGPLPRPYPVASYHWVWWNE